MIDFDELADDIAALALNSDVTNESGETRSVREVVGRYLRPVEIELNRLRGDAASLAAAREQLLAQAAEIKRLLRAHYEIERLKKACELYRQASIQSHTGHWDPTGKWGAGCPECNRASQLRSEAEAALKEEDTHEMVR